MTDPTPQKASDSTSKESGSSSAEEQSQKSFTPPAIKHKEKLPDVTGFTF